MIGKTFSRYEIIGKLGEGGMGQAWLAHDASLDRKVALKFLSEETRKHPEARRRLLREARSAAAIDHPYACKIYEVGHVDGTDFIAMEYVEGQTLADRLASGPLPPELAAKVVTEIAEALSKAHSSGIIHRDLKPANVMLCTDGHAKVMDFGLAKAWSWPETSDDRKTVSALTAAGTLMGTPGYMSPEQLRGESLGPASDLFSLGVLLYELLSGDNPFRGRTPADWISAILHVEPPALPASINPALRGTVTKLLAKDAESRYANAGELLDDLRSLDGSGPDHRATRRSRMWIPLLAAGGIFLAAAAVVSWRGGFRQPDETVDFVQLEARDHQARAQALMENFSDPESLRLSIEAWQKVLELRADDPAALAGLANARVRYAWNSSPDPDMLAAAQQEAERAIRLDPEVAGSYSALTYILIMRGLFDAAEQMSLRSVEVGPEDPDVLQARARFLMDYRGDFVEAEELARKATTLAPTNYPAWFQLGWAQMELGRLGEATESFRVAIDLRPNFAAAYLGLGTTLNIEHRFDEARAVFDEALRVDPNSTQALFFQGVSYHFLRRHTDSLARFDRVVRSNPEHPLASDALLYAAVEYRALGRLEEAEAALESAENAFKATPEAGWSLMGLAGVGAVRGRPEEAFAWLNRAVASGFRSGSYLLLSPALEPLMNDARFEGIVSQMSAAPEAH